MVAPQASRVCIVDDEAGVRELLELVCDSAGLPSASFGSAEAFLTDHAAAPDACGLVLLDIDLPGISGLDLLARLKAQGHSVPAIMISGGADGARVTQAKALGAADFFGKPFDVRAIRDRICQLLGRDG